MKWTELVPSNAPARRKFAFGLAGFAATSTLAVMLSLMAFDLAPGLQASAPAQWPLSSPIERSGKRGQLLVFVHPLCSCTRASISELAKLAVVQQFNPTAPAILLVAFRPQKDSGRRWSAPMWKISELPGAGLVWDDGGLEAKRFGATTSGTVLLYDSEGKLLFQGGVTGSRGHEGDNYGLDELRRALTARLPGEDKERIRGALPVFGCAFGSFGPGKGWEPTKPMSYFGRVL